MALPSTSLMLPELLQTCQELTKRGLKYAATFTSELLLALASRADDSEAACAPADDAGVEPFSRYYCEFLHLQRFPPQPPPPTTSTLGNSTFTHQSDDTGVALHVHLIALLGRLDKQWGSEHLDHDNESSAIRFEGETAIATPARHDSYSLWLCGAVVRKLGRLDQAFECFLNAVALRPYNWAAWVEIADLILLLPKAKPQESSSSSSSSSSRSRGTQPPAEVLASFLPWPELQKSTVALGDVINSSLCGWILCSQLLRLRNDLEGAMAVLCTLRERLGDEYPQLMHWTAQTLVLQKRRAEAFALYRQIREQHPFRLEGLDAFAYFLAQQPHDETLDELARDAIRINRTAPETYVILGVYMNRKGQWQQAVAHLERALRIAPHSPQAWYLLGRALLESEISSAKDKAIDCFFRATRLDPYLSEAWTALTATFPRSLKRQGFEAYYKRKAT